MERMTHRRSDGSAYSDLDMQTCLNRLADYEDLDEADDQKIHEMVDNKYSYLARHRSRLKEDKDARTD